MRLASQFPLQSIVVYLVENHPLEFPSMGPAFRWLHDGNDFKRELEGLIGPKAFDEDELSLLIDDAPGGSEWQRLLRGLLDGKVRMVVTHLAPLSSAKRQQLIGICAETGAHLITPADAGRTWASEQLANV
jgi:hypothetical protein